MNHKNIWAVLFLALSITACTQDDAIAPAPAVPDADNALAQLPGNTPVRIITVLDGEETDSRTDAAAPTFTVNEIHEEGTMKASLYKVDINEGIQMDEGGAYRDESGTKKTPDFTATDESSNEYVAFDGISNMKNGSGSTLTLSDVPEGQWTVLVGEKQSTSSNINITDSIIGWSKVVITEGTEEPVLFYHMNRTRAKVTLQLKNHQTKELMCLCRGVEASVWAKRTVTSVIPKENSFEMAIYDRVEDSKNSLGWCALGVPVTENGTALNSDYSGTHEGKSDITQLTGLVYATATHKLEGGTYSSISDGTFNVDTQNEAFLSVEINHGHDDQTNHPDYPHLDTESGEGGGYYSIKLREIEMGNGNKLNKLEAGKHYIITLELEHNTLVGATATLGAWTEYTGSADLTDDESKVDDNGNVNP